MHQNIKIYLHWHQNTAKNMYKNTPKNSEINTSTPPEVAYKSTITHRCSLFISIVCGRLSVGFLTPQRVFASFPSRIVQFTHGFFYEVFHPKVFSFPLGLVAVFLPLVLSSEQTSPHGRTTNMTH